MPQIVVELHLDGDVAAKRARKHVLHRAQVQRETHRLGIDRAAARERQQVSREAGAAGDRASHRVENVLPLLARPAALQNLDAAREHRKQVVEIVCDSAGQLAQRLQALRLA